MTRRPVEGGRPGSRSRREFVRDAAGALIALAVPGLGGGCASLGSRAGTEGVVMTVRGPISPTELGVTLPHEHLASTVGSEITPGADHDYGEGLGAVVLPHLRRLRELGVRTVVDAGPAYIGRAPESLRQLSLASGLHLITTTGYYGAAGDRYVPAHARVESPERLAERWVAEWEGGIGQTGIRPGLIKIGVDPGPLSEIDAKLVRAAAVAHRATGLAIAAHTGGSNEAVRGQLAILDEARVSPEAWIWVHAQGAREVDDLALAAGEGAWISLDGLQPDNAPGYAARVRELAERGHLGRILLSHDSILHRTDGRDPRPAEGLHSHLLPLLRRDGFGEEEIRRLTVENPRRALTLRSAG